MSRQIDMSKPLSPEDREWLKSNNRESEIAANDAEHGVETDDPAKTGGLPPVTGNEPSLSSDRLVPTGLVPNQSGDLDAERRAAQLKSAMEGGPAGTAGEGDVVYETDDKPYEDWSLAELQDQAGKRELSKSGTKAELASRLRADDDEREDETDTE